MLLIVIGALGAIVASFQLTGILGAVAWAFCFACSGLFFPLVLGVWWKRATTAGAIAGMVLGFGAGSVYLWWTYTTGQTLFELNHLRFGIIGMPVSLVAMVVVSLMTPAPSEEVQQMVDNTRDPSGSAILEASH